MSRIIRVNEVTQPALLLGHGPVHWDTLPTAVRERVLALWIEMLTDHLALETSTSITGRTGSAEAQP